jgi:hypothetical protein
VPLPLLPAQHWTWVDHHAEESPPYLVNTVSAQVPEGVTLDGLSRVIAELSARHDGLRMTFHIGPGGDPVQQEHPDARPTVAPFEAGADTRTAIEAAEERLLGRLTAPFDLGTQLPVRAAALTVLGQPRQLWLALHHIIGDIVSLRVVRREVQHCLDRLADGLPPALPPVRWSVRDQVAHETSAEGSAAAHAALAHWHDVFRRQPYDLPPRRFGDCPADGFSMTLRSRPLARLVQDIATSEGSTRAAVVTTALALCLANVKGRDTTLLRPNLANRSHPRLNDLVCTTITQGWLLVDLRGDPAFRDVLRETTRALFVCMKHGRCDNGALFMHKIARGADRAMDGAPQINHTVGAPEEDDLPSGEQERLEHHAYDTLGGFKFAVEDHGRSLHLNVQANRGLLDLDEAESIVRGLTPLLEQVAADPRVRRTRLRGVPARWVPPNEHWVDHRGSWIHLPDLVRTLESCPGVRLAAAFRGDERGAGEELLAGVVAGPGVSPEALRLGLLDARPLLGIPVVPDWFVIRDAAPDVPDSPAAWLAPGPGLTAQGTGTALPQRSPTTTAEASLLSRFAELHPDSPPVLERSYAELGGAFARIPAMLRGLRKDGVEGLTIADLMSTLPLSRLAERVTGSC